MIIASMRGRRDGAKEGGREGKKRKTYLATPSSLALGTNNSVPQKINKRCNHSFRTTKTEGGRKEGRAGREGKKTYLATPSSLAPGTSSSVPQKSTNASSKGSSTSTLIQAHNSSIFCLSMMSFRTLNPEVPLLTLRGPTGPHGGRL